MSGNRLLKAVEDVDDSYIFSEKLFSELWTMNSDFLDPMLFLKLKV